VRRQIRHAPEACAAAVTARAERPSVQTPGMDDAPTFGMAMLTERWSEVE